MSAESLVARAEPDGSVGRHFYMQYHFKKPQKGFLFLCAGEESLPRLENSPSLILGLGTASPFRRARRNKAPAFESSHAKRAGVSLCAHIKKDGSRRLILSVPVLTYFPKYILSTLLFK